MTDAKGSEAKHLFEPTGDFQCLHRCLELERPRRPGRFEFRGRKWLWAPQAQNRLVQSVVAVEREGFDD